MYSILKTFKKYLTLQKIFVVFFIGLLNLISACSIPVSDVSISGKGRPHYEAVYVKTNFNADLIGTSSVMPASASLIMPDHSVSAGTQRTASSSSSLQMTSGIGLQ